LPVYLILATVEGGRNGVDELWLGHWGSFCIQWSSLSCRRPGKLLAFPQESAGGLEAEAGR